MRSAWLKIKMQAPFVSLFTTESTEKHGEKIEKLLSLSVSSVVIIFLFSSFTPPSFLSIGNVLFTKPSSREVSSFTVSSPKATA